MTFYVGQKVVCVEEPKCAVKFPWREFPKQGAIYTVRGFKNEASIWLREIENFVGCSGKEAGFCPSRFRPLVSDTRKVSFTEGAPKDSERWDNRKQKVRA